MTIQVTVLESATEYEAALRRIEHLMAENQESGDAELEALALLVQNYEEKEFSIEDPDPDPIDAILFRMAQLQFDAADVARKTGIREDDISTFLERERPLSLDAIRKLSNSLDLPAQILIQPYLEPDAADGI